MVWSKLVHLYFQLPNVFMVRCFIKHRYTNTSVLMETMFWGAFAELRKVTENFAVSVRPYGTTRLPMDEFSRYFIFDYFSKICRENPCLINPLNPELNPICYLLALLGARHFLHVSRIRVKLLTFRLLMSYIYGASILDVSRSHTTTQHSR